MGSTRFPGKPLADICGNAMIYHVYYRSKMCSLLDDVFIATPDKEIKQYCKENNMNVIMTKDTHERASDRAAEAMLRIEKKYGAKIQIVVMIQGDEPMVFPQMIKEAVKPMMTDDKIKVVTLLGELKSEKEEKDSNQVKIVIDKNGDALYFSREPIPSRKKTKDKIKLYRQVPIIPFTRSFLLEFNSLKPMPLEIIESVDLLRVLEHGYKVRCIHTEYEILSVDAPQDLKKVQRVMKKDKLVSKY
jgi:3-deoxy-manno-octulosonate cytidylyltransferase (CMP-KDO synthetase)